MPRRTVARPRPESNGSRARSGGAPAAARSAAKARPQAAAKQAGRSDAAVRRRTGKGWQDWSALLDRAQAWRLPHAQIAALLDAQDVAGWWAQDIAVAYEQERGLRASHQRARWQSTAEARRYKDYWRRSLEALRDLRERTR